MKHDLSTLGKRLKHVRLACGYTQDDVGHALGYNSGCIVAHWEAGNRMPSAQNLCNLLIAFPALNLHWLLTGNGDWVNKDYQSENVA